MTQDLYYYESGYIDVSYFVYTADAEAQVSSTSSVSCNIGVIKNSNATLTVTVEVTATISHIEGADLFAMTNAALAAEASRIRDNNIDASSAFSIATDASRTRHYSSDESADFTIAVANLRVRFNEAAVNAAFSLTADVELVPGGEVLQGEAVLSSEFTIDAKGTRKQNIIDEDVSAEFTISITAERFAGLAGAFESQINQQTDANRLRDAPAALISAFSQSADVNETVQLAADLTSTASVTATISHIEGADLFAMTDATLSATADRFRGIESSQTAQATVTADLSQIKLGASSLTSAFSQTAEIIRQRDASADLSSAFSQTASVSKFTDYFTIQIKDVPDGTNQWYSYPKGLYVDASGNMYSSGTMGTGATGYSGYPSLTKVNKLGEHQWTKTVQTLDKSFANLVVDSSENLYTAIENSNSVFKYDTSGSVVWRYNTSNTSVSLVQTAIDSSDNLIAVGSITISTVQYAYVIKINSGGTLQWSKRFTVGSSGTNVITDGTSIYMTIGSYLIKLDSTGAHVWTRRIAKNSTNISNISALNKDSSGNVYASCVDSASTGYFVIKINSSGTKLWHRDYDSQFDDIYTTGSDLYVLGNTAVASLDSSNGSIIWQKDYSPGNTFYVDGSSGLVVKNSGLYYSGVIVESINPYQYSNLLLKFPTDGSGLPTVGTYTVSTISDTTTSTTSFNTTAATVTNVTGITLSSNTTTLGTDSPTVTFNAVNPGGYVLSGAAAVTSAFALTGSLDTVKLIQATITSTAALTAQPDNNLKSGTAALSANGFVVAATGRIRPQIAGLDSAFTLSVSADKIKNAEITLTSEFILTANVLDLDLAQANLTSAFALTAQGDRYKLMSAGLTSASSVYARATKTLATWSSDSWYRGFVDISAERFVIFDSMIIEAGNYSSSGNEAGVCINARDIARGTPLWSIELPYSSITAYTQALDPVIREYLGYLYVNVGYQNTSYSPNRWYNVMTVIDPETQTIVASFSTNFAREIVDFVIDDTGIYYSGLGGDVNFDTTLDPVIAKTDLTGSVQWKKFADSGNTSTGRSRVFLVNNKLYWYFTRQSITNLDVASLAIVDKSTGAASHRLLGLDGSGDLHVDASENIYIVGSTDTPLSANGIITKVNSAGTTQWTKGVINSVGDGLVQVDADGNVYLAEQATDPLNQYWTVYKLDSSGSVIWAKQFTDSTDSADIHALLPYDDRLIIVGRANNESITINVAAVDGDRPHANVPFLTAYTNAGTWSWLDYSPSWTNKTYTIGTSTSLTLSDVTFNNYTFTPSVDSATPTAFTYLYVVEAIGSWSSQFSHTIAYTRIRPGASQQQVSAVQSTTALKLAQLSANLSSTTSQTTTGLRVRTNTVSMSTNSTVTCAVTKFTGYNAALTAEAVLASEPNRLRGITTAETAEFTQTTDSTRIRAFDATFTAFYTELTAAAKNATGTILMETSVAISADARKITDSPQYLFSQTNMSVQGFNIQFGQSHQTTTSTFNLIPTYLRRNEAALTSTTALTTPGERIRPGASSQAVQAFAFPATDNSKITGYSSALTSTSQMTTNNQILRLAQANLLATTATPLVFAGVLVRFEANLQVSGFQLTAGQVINIDLYYQLKIPSETRTLWIEPESRILTIDSETRVNKIKGYPSP